jgi:uncharacterized protein YbjT (DUF2867 family)
MRTHPCPVVSSCARPAPAAGRVLVMGASGTVGSEVVRRLVAAGERPLAFARDPERARKRLGAGAGLVVGDLDRPETVEAGLAGVERVFLLTRQNSQQPDWERKVVQAAARSGVRHLVKLSVFRADDDSPLRIARQHREAERVLEQSGLAFTILRPVFFMQNLFGMLRNGTIHTAALDGPVAMIDARDIARVAATVLTTAGHEARTYTLTGPEPLTFDEVAGILSAQIGVRIGHVRVTSDDVRGALQRTGVPAWFADDMAKLHRMLAGGYENVVTEDVRAVTGRSACTFEQFARDFAGPLAGLAPAQGS